MIQANELRIGNNVLQNGRVVYVESISEDRGIINVNIETELDGSAWLNGIDLNELDPIPLTPEILEKFGFEKDDNDLEFHHEDFCSWYEKEYPIIGRLVTSNFGTYLFDEETDTLRIYFLHQLQNLYFALTGQELEVNL